MARMVYAVLAVGCALAGCTQPKTSNDNLAANDALATDTNPAAPGVSADTMVDAGFVADAMKGNNSEIAMGRMAQQMGESNAVKDFGALLAFDHAGANTRLKELATRAKLPLTDDLTDEAKAASAKLKALSGAAFDKEFKTMAVADHEKDIAKYEAQASSPNRDTAAYATATLPTLKKHLEAAKAL